MSALVVIVEGQAPIVYTNQFTVGRKGADLIINDEYASPLHAHFTPGGESWFVADMGSTNGIYINGSLQRVYGMWRLSKGDRIKIGHMVLTVVPTGS